MGFGPINVISLDAVDMVSPGAPGLSASQVNNLIIKASVTIPTVDSDGNSISGIQKVIVGMVVGDAVNVFDGISGEDISRIADANGGQSRSVDLVDVDVGKTFDVDFSVISLGKRHYIAASVTDGQ